MAETLSFEATGASSFTPGPYTGRLVRIDQKYKQREKPVYDPERGEKVVRKVDDPYLIWTFQILDEGFEHKTLTSLSGTSMGFKLNGEPAKARTYAQALLGHELEIGEKFSSEDLIGREATLHIDNEKTPRGEFARVVAVSPIQTEEAKGKASGLSDTQDLAPEDEAAMEEVFNKVGKK